MLLQHDADPRGGFPMPYLHRAMRMGPERVAEAIWHAGACFAQHDARGRSALTLAAKYKRTGILMRMLPLAAPETLLDTLRSIPQHVMVMRETRRRVAGLDRHIASVLDTWQFPNEIERIVLEYLYKRPPQHNGARKTS